MKNILIILVCFLTCSVYGLVDDKTSPFAYNIARQFGLALGNRSFQCLFSDQSVKCDPRDNFRSFDGTCNNLKQPLLGSAQTPHKRLLRPAYDDGVSRPRSKSVSGNPLPNPRRLSINLSSDPFNTQELIWTHLWVIFGQFLTHDITSTALSNGMFNFFYYWSRIFF